ncbi:MAG: hypothetical protein FJZ57_03680 [Chlamydiae bacterium]|nr:hypothetical protein [Chlamydiota bacterium]
MMECSCQYNKIFQRIKNLSSKEKKNLLQKMVKLQEEVGELAEAVLIHENASGSEYKSKNEHAIEKEITDILLVSLDMFYSLNPSEGLLEHLLTEKSQKWEHFQSK